MAISDAINGVISKGSFALGAASALSSFLPPSLQKSLGAFINGTPQRTKSNRNLNDFRATLNKYGGLARNSLFYVEIPIPTIFAREAGQQVIVDSKDIALLCESATLPGVSLATSDIRRYGVGAQEKKPYGVTFTDQTFSFLGDNRGNIHKYFYAWMNGIVKNDLLPNPSGYSLHGFNGLSPFEVEYKDEYAVDIKITCYDETAQDIIICKLNRAYPIYLGDVQLSWEESNNFMKIPVTFTYYNWNLERVNINSALQSPADNISGLQKLLKVGTAIQTLASLRAPTGIADIINVVSNAKIAVGAFSVFR